MKLKDIVDPPAEHIIAAGRMAEKIFQEPPAIQVEMLGEIKKKIIKRTQAKLEEFRNS